MLQLIKQENKQNKYAYCSITDFPSLEQIAGVGACVRADVYNLLFIVELLSSRHSFLSRFALFANVLRP